MPRWKLNIFTRVVKRRMANENKSADEVLISYTALTDIEKQEIKGSL